MSREPVEKFAVEVAKSFQNLFNEELGEKLEDFLTKEGKDTVSSQDESPCNILAEDLLEESISEKNLEEISATDLLREDVIEEIVDSDALEDLLADDSAESVLNSYSIEDVINDPSYADSLDDAQDEDATPDDTLSQSLPGGQPHVAGKAGRAIGEYKFYPFRLLKSIVLSLDWEITEGVMDRFVDQVARLLEIFKNDKDVLVYLHLLWELGKYFQKHGSKSHPNTIHVLTTVFYSLEKTLSGGFLSEEDKKTILFTAVDKVKRLKKEISAPQAPASPPETNPPEKTMEKPDMYREGQILSDAMTNAIQMAVKAEFYVFLKELGDWITHRK